MRVVEPGNDGAPAQVDNLSGRSFVGHGLGIAAHGDKTAILDGHGGGVGVLAVDGVQLAVEQNQIGVHRASLEWSS